jgi:L-threonylcarbamoyladenylate synthase
MTADAAELERCLAAGGVAVFPTDTVYGLCCDPENPAAVERLYALKGRTAGKPAAIMFFSLDAALAALPELGPRTRAALAGLLPGPLTLVFANPRRRFPLACGETIGLRVPDRPLELRRPLLQSSANLAGGADARRLADVPEEIRAGADLLLDGGELPGRPSSVIDLTAYEQAGTWRLARRGAGDLERAARVLDETLAPRRGS